MPTLACVHKERLLLASKGSLFFAMNVLFVSASSSWHFEIRRSSGRSGLSAIAFESTIGNSKACDSDCGIAMDSRHKLRWNLRCCWANCHTHNGTLSTLRLLGIIESSATLSLRLRCTQAMLQLSLCLSKHLPTWKIIFEIFSGLLLENPVSEINWSGKSPHCPPQEKGLLAERGLLPKRGSRRNFR